MLSKYLFLCWFVFVFPSIVNLLFFINFSSIETNYVFVLVSACPAVYGKSCNICCWFLEILRMKRNKLFMLITSIPLRFILLYQYWWPWPDVKVSEVPGKKISKVVSFVRFLFSYFQTSFVFYIQVQKHTQNDFDVNCAYVRERFDLFLSIANTLLLAFSQKPFTWDTCIFSYLAWW